MIRAGVVIADSSSREVDLSLQRRSEESTSSGSGGSGRQIPPPRAESRRSGTSHTPALPSEPDVFMDEKSFSDHVQSSSHADVHPSLAERSNSKGRLPSGPLADSPPISSRKGKERATIDTIEHEIEPQTKGQSRATSRDRSTKRITEWHDPEIWAQPSFLRRKTSPARSPMINQGDSRVRGMKRKRTTDVASSSPASAHDHRPLKKKKSRHSVASTPPVTRVQHTSGGARNEPAEETRTSAKASDMAVDHAQAAPQRDSASTKTTTAPTTKPKPKVRNIDLQREASVVSSASSRSRSRKPRQTSELAFSRSAGSVTDHTHWQPDREEIAPQSRIRAQPNGEVEPERAEVQDPLASGSQLSAPNLPPAKQKLGGFKLDLALRPRTDPSLVTWQTLDKTLLAIGRARHKEKLNRLGKR